ncbi:MAG: extracellular solute-binding protein [Chloroflexi bacterium]|nr:extracellular solute-binding protein [Chloroflexota bacterium]
MKKRLLIMATVVALLGVFAACAASVAPAPPDAVRPAPAKESARAEWETRWSQVIAAARQEGKVMLYGQVGPLFKQRLAEAMKAYGVEVDTLSGKSTEIAQKYLMERSANLYLADVLFTGTSTTLTLIKPKGVLASLKPHLILPEVLDTKVWPEGRLPFLDRDQNVLALIAGYNRYVAINTEQVRQREMGYPDLLDPRWRGKITMFDPSMGGAGGNWFAFLMETLGREAGEKYMRELARQDIAVTRDARLHVETMAKGKYAFAIGAAYQSLQEFAQAGAPVDWAKMKEGGMVTPGPFTASLPDKPAHPNAAILMLNYLLTKEGQLAASEAAGLPAMRLDAPTTYVMPGAIIQPGEKVVWTQEDSILREPTLYPLAREIFNIR